MDFSDLMTVISAFSQFFCYLIVITFDVLLLLFHFVQMENKSNRFAYIDAKNVILSERLMQQMRHESCGSAHDGIIILYHVEIKVQYFPNCLEWDSN